MDGTSPATDSASQDTASDAAAQEDTAVLETYWGFVRADEVEEKVPLLDISSLSQVTGWTDMAQGSKGEQVRKFQEILISLGFLTGAADGSFGPGTASAANAFLQSVGFTPDGKINVFRYFVLLNMAYPTDVLETQYPLVVTAEEKYAAIFDGAEHTEWLDQMLDKSWKIEYDALEGSGTIENEVCIAAYSEEERSIDRIYIELYLTVMLQREADVIHMTPALRAVTQGAYRPYVQAAIIQSGNTTVQLAPVADGSGIEGTMIWEEAYLEFSEEAANDILSSADGISIIRLKGTNKDFDIDITGEGIGAIKAFLQMAG